MRNRSVSVILVLLLGSYCVAAEPESAAPIVITVDANQVLGKISPLVYGINFVDWAKYPDVTITRQGGNRMTAWNWETNASNAGSDWHHQSDDFLGGGDKVGEVARAFVAPAFERGKSVIITVPTIGYVSADKKADGDVNQTPNYLETRFNKSVAKKNSPFSDPPDLNDHTVYQDEFVWWLNKQFPIEKRHGGQIFYALDNEPDIWASTHARIHPAKVTYAEMVQRTREYSAAIKDVDPTAVVFGFVSYGFGGYLHLQDAPDAKGRDFIEFFLGAMSDVEKRDGRRLLDVLDLHWYPEIRPHGQRITEQTIDPESVRIRVQAPRSLWDPTYTEPDSWVTKDVLKEPVKLIPRLKAKIEKYYPGTKLAFTEFDYGAVNHISGAVAVADVLGIFGQEGVFAATEWGGGPFSFAAFNCYRDFDGKGSNYGDLALSATSSRIEDLAVHASKFENGSDDLVLVLVNRAESARTCRLDVNNHPFTKVTLYRLGGDAPKVKPAGSVDLKPGESLTLPAMSVTTAVLSR
ncbi:MAG TPA: glycoside hydrolase family 44 protein [Tepidisphaeraceae bacterium]